MLVMLLEWARCPRRPSEAKASQARKAKEVLHAIVHRALVGHTWAWSVPDLGKNLIISDGNLQAAALLSNTPLRRRQISKDNKLPVADAMMELTSIVNSGGDSDAVGVASDVVRALIGLITTIFEVYDNFDRVRDNHGCLPVLRLMSQRPRRVPLAKKLDLVAGVSQSPALTNPGQIVAAQALSARRRGEGDLIDPRSARRFVRDSMYQYFVCVRKAWEHTACCNIALDAGSISSEELLIQAIADTDANICAWVPPQVSEALKMAFSKK